MRIIGFSVPFSLQGFQIGLPELMSMFKQVADIRTADTLKLDVPDCDYQVVQVEATPFQQELVQELAMLVILIVLIARHAAAISIEIIFFFIKSPHILYNAVCLLIMIINVHPYHPPF